MKIDLILHISQSKQTLVKQEPQRGGIWDTGYEIYFQEWVYFVGLNKLPLRRHSE